jgi:hypothetical protein
MGQAQAAIKKRVIMRFEVVLFACDGVPEGSEFITNALRDMLKAQPAMTV